MRYYSATTGGFYDPTINPTIPEDAVEVSPELYGALMAAVAAGKRIVPDATGAPTIVEQAAPSLSATKQAALRALDTQARYQRARWATENKDRVYASKLEEASRYLAASSPEDLTGYPFLLQESQGTDTPAGDVVQLWLARSAAVTPALAAIEGTLMGAKQAIQEAVSNDAVAALLAGVQWPSGPE